MATNGNSAMVVLRKQILNSEELRKSFIEAWLIIVGVSNEKLMHQIYKKISISVCNARAQVFHRV
jgi:hypothetical protein